MRRATNSIGLRLIAWGVGAGAGLLLARLVARLLAGRPDNPTLALLYWLTDPLVLPLARLDAGQPRFGAVLELATLALLVALTLLGYLTWHLAQRWWLRSRGEQYD